ncbi:Adenine nucleotide alpha hydrolases-like superfamily protein [Hirschfeldia incana]|nr:Adenine nucleotide alpha hydrolases-like superfamily protein [Hirschfeldia incana]
MERNEEREGPIAIAVDRDKTSIQALKWAIENHIPQGGTLRLVHVIQRSASGPNTDDELSEREQKVKQSTRFLPLRCLCASLKKGITRLFKVDDIPSNVMRWAPDFCSVLVISKGRLSSVRSATRPLPQALPSPSSGTAPLSPLSNTDELPSEMSLSREDDVFFDEFSSLDTDSSANISGRISTESLGLSFYKKLGAPPQMLEIPRLISGPDDEKYTLSMYLNSPSDEKSCSLASPLLPPMDEAEAEKRRLKKELKETMNKYHAAYKEALMANEKIAELEIWKRKAEKRIQMAEETATMAIMEMDKRKMEAEMKVVRRRGSDERKVVLDDLGESHIVVKYESLLHIVIVLFFFCFYFTYSSLSSL